MSPSADKIVPLHHDIEILPLRDWILLKERPKRNKEHRIVMPDTASSPRLAKWEVVAIGPGVESKLEPGDAVVVQPAHVMIAPIDGVPHGLVQEAGLVAVVRGDTYYRAGIIEGIDGFIE